MKTPLIRPLTDAERTFLSDESKLTGSAQSISFPENEAEIRTVLEALAVDRVPITVQGAKTGISGGAVPRGGHVLNLGRMNRVKSFCTSSDGRPLLRVESGLTLSDLTRAVARLKSPTALFWPAAPSETGATVGGVVANAANGICAGVYGAPGSHIEALRVMDADGTAREFTRTDADGADTLMAACIGGEGMYGVVTELTLRLLPKPASTWGIAFFFEDRGDGLAFARAANEIAPPADADVAAVESLDRATIDGIAAHKDHLSAIRAVPDVASRADLLVYVEIHGDREAAVEAVAENLMDLAVARHSDVDASWAFSGEMEMRPMHRFLHAAIETALLDLESVRREHPSIIRLGVDFALGSKDPAAMVENLEKGLHRHGLVGNFLGHIGRGRLHLNLRPQDEKAYARGREMLEQWADEGTALTAASVKAYGVGKLNKHLFRRAASPEQVGRLVRLKQHLDPGRRWNPGNMIDRPFE